MSQLEALFSDGKLRALGDALAQAEGLERQRYLGLLAAAGQGPLDDLWGAARAHLEAGSPHAAELVALAVRRLHAAGFVDAALELVSEARPQLSDTPELELLGRQLKSKVVRGDDEASWLAARALASGDDGKASVALLKVADSPGASPRARITALQAAADLARASCDLDAAAQASTRARALLPEADDVDERRLVAGLDMWAAGHADGLDLLRAVRGQEGAPRRLRRLAGEAIDAIEHHPGQPARFTSAGYFPSPRGHDITSVIADFYDVKLEPGTPPTMSHLRAALQPRRLVTTRVILSEELIARLLDHEVMIVLEEEQASHAGFLVIYGMEAHARLLLLRDPARPGAFFRTTAEQWRRSALSGRGALIITGRNQAGEALRKKLRLKDDPRLTLVDRAHFEADDPDVPHAHVANLAREAVAEAPDIPMGHRRLGQALLALRRLGRDDGELEQWLVSTRERFPEADWPLQVHAQLLELEDHDAEALAVWADAARLDDEDPRNHLGEARAARAAGLSGSGDSLRRALTLAPRDAAGWTWLAELYLGERRLDAAGLAAALASELDPEAIATRLVCATIAEQRGELEQATRELEAAHPAGQHEDGQTIRLWRRYLAAGAWAAQDRLEKKVLKATPQAVGAWSVRLDGLVARGDGKTATTTLLAALRRHGPQPMLLENLVDVLGILTPPAALPALHQEIVELLADQPDARLRIARSLAYTWGTFELSIPALEVLASAHPADVNVAYTQALVAIAEHDRTGHPERTAVIDEALARAARNAPRFAWVRYVMGWRKLEQAPGETLELVAPFTDAAPGPFWDLMARAFDRLGQADKARELRGRVPAVVGDMADHAEFLRDRGLSGPAAELLALAVQRAPTPALRLELARCLAVVGEQERACDEAQTAWLANRDPWTGLWAARFAVLARRVDLARATAQGCAAACRGDSRRYADPWPLDAIDAGAAVAAGDLAPRERLLAAAPSHPVALRALARTTRLLAAPTASDDLANLQRVAPGSAWAIDHVER